MNCALCALALEAIKLLSQFLSENKMDMYTHQSMPPRPQQDMPYDLRPRSLQWDEVMDSDSNCTMSPTTSSSLQFPAVHMPAPQELFLLSPQATAAYQDSPVELGGYPDVNATSNVLSTFPSAIQAIVM